MKDNLVIKNTTSLNKRGMIENMASLLLSAESYGSKSALADDILEGLINEYGNDAPTKAYIYKILQELDCN